MCMPIQVEAVVASTNQFVQQTFPHVEHTPFQTDTCAPGPQPAHALPGKLYDWQGFSRFGNLGLDIDPGFGRMTLASDIFTGESCNLRVSSKPKP